MLNTNDILETIQMITDEHLDVRTVTMGISLLDCADPDPAEQPAKRSTTRSPTKAKDLVKTAEDISAHLRHSHRQQAHLGDAHRHAAGSAARPLTR